MNVHNFTDEPQNVVVESIVAGQSNNTTEAGEHCEDNFPRGLKPHL